MNRAIYLNMDERSVLARCSSERVGISAIEPLPKGGVRLVCMSVEGAARLRRKLKADVMVGAVDRERHRPRSPLW